MSKKIREGVEDLINLGTDALTGAIQKKFSPENIRKKAVDKAWKQIRQFMIKDEKAILATDQYIDDAFALQLVSALGKRAAKNVARRAEAKKRLYRRQNYSESISDDALLELRGGVIGRRKQQLAPIYSQRKTKSTSNNTAAASSNHSQSSDVSDIGTQSASNGQIFKTPTGLVHFGNKKNQNNTAADNSKKSSIGQGIVQAQNSAEQTSIPGATPSASGGQIVKTSTGLKHFANRNNPNYGGTSPPPPPPDDTPSDNKEIPQLPAPTSSVVSPSYLIYTILAGAAQSFNQYAGFSSQWTQLLDNYPTIVAELNAVAKSIRDDSTDKEIRIQPLNITELKQVLEKLYNLAAQTSRVTGDTDSDAAFQKKASMWGYKIRKIALNTGDSAVMASWKKIPVVILLKNGIQMNWYKDDINIWEPFFGIDTTTNTFIKPNPASKWDNSISDQITEIFRDFDLKSIGNVENVDQFTLKNGEDNLKKWSSITESYNKLNYIFEKIVKSI